MAIVYLARDPLFGRQVALKVLPSQFKLDPQYLVRFQREAKVIAALEHPYIVPVYDYGEEGDQPFLVMRHMAGGTLAGRMQAGPLALGQVAAIVQRLAEALDEAHTQGVVHRDLKPTNVLFDLRDQPYLSDFGIAKILADSATSSLTGSGVVGTPTYMSPEQAMGDRHIDHRSDIYALGVMVYEMLMGRHPYEATTPMRVLLKHISDPVPQIDLAELQRLGLTKDLNDILSKALAKKPEERYATASQLARPLTLLTAPAQRAEAPSDPTRMEAPVEIQPSPRVSGSATLLSSAKAQATPLLVAPASPGVPWPWLLGGALGMVLIAGVLSLGVWLGSVVTRTPTPTLTPTQAATVTLPAATAAPTQLTGFVAFTETPPPTATATPTLTPTEMPSATPTATLTRRPTRIPPTTTLAPTPLLTDTPTPLGDSGGGVEPQPPTLAPP